MVYLRNILTFRHFSSNERSIFGLALFSVYSLHLFFWILNCALTTKYDLNSKHVVRQCGDSSFAKFKMVWNNFIFWRSILTIISFFFSFFFNSFNTESLLSILRSRALKSRGSYGNSALFLKRSHYISLDFHILRKSQKAMCGS